MRSFQHSISILTLSLFCHIFCFLSFSMAQEDVGQESLIQKRGTTNLSNQFSETYKIPGFDKMSKEQWQLLKNEYTIILSPGYLSDISPAGYFKEAVKLFKLRGLKDGQDFIYLQTHSRKRSEKNFPMIEKALIKAKKKVLYIGHSKGASDFARFLAKYKNNPLLHKLGGFLPIQGPLYGSGAADDTIKPKNKKLAFFKVLLNRFDKKLKAFREFSTGNAGPFMQENDEYFRHLSFPVLSFSSSIDTDNFKNSPQSLKTTVPLLRTFHQTLRDKKISSDGLVPTENAIFPGCPYVVAEGLDHSDTVVSLGKRGQRKNFLESFLKVYLDHFHSPKVPKE